MLDKHRSRATPYLDQLADALPGWTPDGLSWLAFGLFALGALALALLPLAPRLSSWLVPVLFLAAAFLVFAGGVFDALDGHVARRRGLASKAGDHLDHVLDRYADVLLLVGIALSGWAQPVLALLALVSLLLVSYMGTQAQAVTGRRQYGGVLGRADRIVLVSGASLLLGFALLFDALVPRSLSVPLRGALLGYTLTPIDLLLVVFVIAGQATAYWRARTTWRSLRSPTGPSAPPGPG